MPWVQVMISAYGGVMMLVRRHHTSYTGLLTQFEGIWSTPKRLGGPPKVQDNARKTVVITGLHWKDAGQGILVASYRHHGIQYVDYHG